MCVGFDFVGTPLLKSNQVPIMPIYEYSCKECQSRFEVLVMGQKTDVTCPKCGGKRNSREFSVFGMKSVSAGGSSTFTSSSGSACGGCTASSCAGCKPGR